MATLTPYDLAVILDAPEHRIRIWLRELFPSKAPGKGNRWEITNGMARKVARVARREGY